MFFASALSQKSSIDDTSAGSKKSTLKSTAKTILAPVKEYRKSIDILQPNSMSTQCSAELLPDQCTARNYLTLNKFSIFILLLIVTLIFLNIYLLAQLYTLKHKQADSIHIDRELLDKLSG